MGNNVLSYNMILAPIKLINHNERKIIVFDIEGCTDEREEVKRKIEKIYNFERFCW